MKRNLVSLVLPLAFVLALTSHAAAQRVEPASPPVIVVTGEALLRVAPDEATVQLGLVRQANTAQMAQDQTNTAGAAILVAIGRIGVAATDIQTSRLTLTPVYAPRSPEASQAPRIAAYQASNVVSVRLSELTKVGPVIDAGLKAGANEIQGVEFALRDDMPVRLEALKQAVGEARKKAEAMAEALNVRLGPPLEVSENSASVVPRNFNGGMMMAPRTAEMAPTPVSPGQLEVHANVTVRYQIVAAPKP